MADITALLAGAAKTNANFNFDEVGKAYWQGLEDAYKKRNRDAFQDPSLYNEDGTINTAKATSQALRMGGIPAAEAVGKINEAGYNQQLQGSANQFRRDLGGGNGPQSSTTPPGGFPPSTSQNGAPKQAASDLTAPKPNAGQQVAGGGDRKGSIIDFLTGNGVSPEQQGPAAVALSKELGGVDPNAPLNLNDQRTRAILKKHQTAIRQSSQSQQPQVQPQPAPPQAAALQPPQAPPQQGGPPPNAQAAIEQRFPTAQAFAPQPPQPPQRVPIQQQQPPIQQRPVQVERIRPPTLVEPNADPTLNNTIPPNLLRLGGGTPQGVLDYLIRVESSLPEKERPGVRKLIESIQEQVKYTEQQRNAVGSGRTTRELQDQPGIEAQDKVVLENTIKEVAATKESASAARDAINSVHRMRALLDSRPGVVTGIWQKDRLTLMRVANLIGVPNSDKIASTQQFNAEAAKTILTTAQQMKGTLSDKDIAFLREVEVAGDLDEKAIRQLLDISEKVSRERIKRHNEQIETVGTALPAIGKVKQIYGVEAPGEYQRPATQLKEGDTVRNKATGKLEKVIGGKLVPQ